MDASVKVMNKIDFESAAEVIKKEIEWAETEGKESNFVSADHHTGYVCGLNQAIHLLTGLLATDELLRYYDYDPNEVGARFKAVADRALMLHNPANKSLDAELLPSDAKDVEDDAFVKGSQIP